MINDNTKFSIRQDIDVTNNNLWLINSIGGGIDKFGRSHTSDKRANSDLYDKKDSPVFIGLLNKLISIGITHHLREREFYNFLLINNNDDVDYTTSDRVNIANNYYKQYKGKVKVITINTCNVSYTKSKIGLVFKEDSFSERKQQLFKVACKDKCILNIEPLEIKNDDLSVLNLKGDSIMLNLCFAKKERTKINNIEYLFEFSKIISNFILAMENIKIKEDTIKQ